MLSSLNQTLLMTEEACTTVLCRSWKIRIGLFLAIGRRKYVDIGSVVIAAQIQDASLFTCMDHGESVWILYGRKWGCAPHQNLQSTLLNLTHVLVPNVSWLGLPNGGLQGTFPVAVLMHQCICTTLKVVLPESVLRVSLGILLKRRPMPPSKRLLWSLLGQQSEGELPQKVACLLSLPVGSAAPTIHLSCEAIHLMRTFEDAVIIHIMRVLLVRTGTGAIDWVVRIRIPGTIIMNKEDRLVFVTTIGEKPVRAPTMIFLGEARQGPIQAITMTNEDQPVRAPTLIL